MNKEVYEVNDKYCAVMSNSKDVRVLSKNSDNDVYYEYLVLENEREKIENKKNRLLNKIDYFDSGEYTLKTVIKGANLGFDAIIVACIILLMIVMDNPTVAYIPKLGFNFVIYSICGSIIISIITPIIYKIFNIFKIKKINKNIKELDQKIAELSKSIERVKSANQIKEMVVIDGINKETAKEISRVVENDLETANYFEKKNMDEVYQIMNNYLLDHGEKEEKGIQYTIGKRK